jgi:hypothetical protein
MDGLNSNGFIQASEIHNELLFSTVPATVTLVVSQPARERRGPQQWGEQEVETAERA